MDIIDSHVHMYNAPECIDYFINYKSKNRFSAINVACLCNLNESMADDAAQNIIAGCAKLLDKNIYAHGGLVYPSFPVPDVIPEEYDFESQARELIEIGFDGIKMLESKPTVRKLTKLSPADKKYNGFYSYLQKEQIPIVSHVADPETFWNAETAPEFSFKEGWFYGDGTFMKKEALYTEIDDILSRFPDLKITFAHFYFLSADPMRANAFLEKHPNVMFDITPGREMYENFSLSQNIWHNLFEKYSHRIMLGTDMTSTEFQGSPSEMIGSIIRFLATTDRFDYWGFRLRGLGLSEQTVKNICAENFKARVSPSPKQINKGMFGKYIEKHVNKVKNQITKKYIIDFAEKNL